MTLFIQVVAVAAVVVIVKVAVIAVVSLAEVVLLLQVFHESLNIKKKQKGT